MQCFYFLMLKELSVNVLLREVYETVTQQNNKNMLFYNTITAAKVT